MRAALALLADVFLVLVFVVIGRASHHAGDGAGVAGTAWPFLAGLAIGEVATRAWRRPVALWPTGVGVWLATVGAGQLLRVISGQGADVAFIIVSAAFLGLFLLGWRLAAWLVPTSSPRIPG
jgi:Protein of unknown function (DUF3054)